MRCISIIFILYFINNHCVKAQTFNSISGKIIDDLSNVNLQNVTIEILETDISILSDIDGNFMIGGVPQGEYMVVFKLEGYESKKIPISIIKSMRKVDLGIFRMSPKYIEGHKSGLISLTSEELYEMENGESNMISGILLSSKDVFLKTVAYEFSPTFFKPRSLGSEYSQVLINGLSMNKLFNSKPQWSNWGGLNDVLRNQEFVSNFSPSRVTFGGISGSTNINTQSSTFRKGTKISYAASNRSYNGRIMASYNSGFLPNNWSFSVSGSRRFANEGFKEGTLYSANSFFVSLGKQISDKHSINFTGIYTSNTRGKSSPMTKEVYDLKNIKYNSYWGNQGNDVRNSRTRRIEEPILQLNHFWKVNKKTSLQTSVMYQFGEVGNSRLDYGGTRIITDGEGNESIIGGGLNPDPTYYQKLPSYFLRDSDNPDYTNAYLAEQEFLKNGQVKWTDLYLANNNAESNRGNTIYALYEDRNDDNQISVNSILYANIRDNLIMNAAVGYKKMKSENYAYMLDLLGGSRFLDVNVYGDNLEDAQNDLQNPYRMVSANERYKYNFILDASVIDGFVQGQYSSRKTDAFISLNFSNTNYQRTGLYENGSFPGNRSLGKSREIRFSNLGIKSGFTYKFSGRHIFNVNGVYLAKAPTLQNSFSNMRENNDVVNGLVSEKIISFDTSYFLRHPKLNLKFTGNWVKLADQTHISFYFADGLTGLNNAENTAFVQEVLTGIDKRNIGIELGLEIPIVSSFKLKGAAAIGESVYVNNPNLYLTSDGISEPLNYGKAYLKNYFVSGGPQRAYSFGFEYNSPKYWWFGATGNYFSNAYINISPITRTSNFLKDDDGQPIYDFDENIARELLKQEKFESYYLINIVGGKSWKLNNYYFGLFANISNILNTKYITGGYEQSRNVNYENLLEDRNRDLPLFGSKYWLGYGTTFYASIYLRI